MAEMRTDSAALASAAATFEKIAGDIQAVGQQIDQVGGEFASHLKGLTGTAVQSALQRFISSQQQASKVVNEISTAVHQSGVQYSKADEEHASSLSAQMNF